MKKYNLVREHLSERQKITLVYQGEFGGLSIIQTTYLGCKPAPHYLNCCDSMVGVSICHKPRGKRKSGYKTISYNVPLIIYDGWQHIDANKIVFDRIDENTLKSKHTMHNNRYFSDLLRAMPDCVIFADMP